MALAIAKTVRRPFWMTPFGPEVVRTIFSDRLLPELAKETDGELATNVDFSEKDGKYFLTAELPGLKRDDISISIEDGFVTVTGKKKAEKEEEGTNYYLKETRSGSFSRSFQLPGKVDSDNVDAAFKDGVLTVTMPKEKAAETKKIEIH